ncbi:hypothetical protein [Geitlerinema sp. PCC 9228]|uniref:hypothetical protein n=1 Tax=Geitlerinema sp. PCC 9228 TaxID=111611 RepID=UPI0008F9D6CB|nr:hypothetical protein [Geitlerinema sp. PCC 9228]
MKRKFPVWLSVAIALVFFGDISRTPNPSPSGAISLETPAASARSSGGRSRGGSFRRNSSPSTSSGSSPQGTSSSSNSSHSPSQRSTSGSSLRGGSFQESSPTPNRSSSTSESDSRQNPTNSQTSPQRTPSPNRSTTPTSPLPSSPSQNHSPTQTVPNRDRAIDEAETRSQSPNTHTSRTGSWIFLAVGGGLFAVVFLAIGRGFLVSLTSNSENTDGESGPSELENEVVTVSKLQIALLAIARDVQQ